LKLTSPEESKDKDVASMLVVLTKEANEAKEIKNILDGDKNM
jgi:hypothetical protein